MIRITQLKLRPGQGIDVLENTIRNMLHLKSEEACSFDVLRQSVDARKKPDIFYVYTVSVSLGNEKLERRIVKNCRKGNIEYARETIYRYASAPHVKREAPGRPVIVGTGPAGLFCGLLLARQGLRPILIERGESARERTRSVHAFWAGEKIDPESNVQFGEGGAGTFSDGKLNTGIKDPQGRIRFILKTFVEAGADPDILYSYKPHVGTDVLTKVVRHITDEIVYLGGEVHFRTRLERLSRGEDGVWDLTCIRTGQVKEQKDLPGSRSGLSEQADLSGQSGYDPVFHLAATKVVLAIGHSARDTFYMLREQGIVLTPKAFAVGLRIQHPQSVIDRAMYGDDCPYPMPPAPYKLTHRLSPGGVYSFCMCPGGYVVNASSENHMLAVNGMSYRGRASGTANSAIVVTVSPEEIASYLKEEEMAGTIGSSVPDALRGIEFQRKLETAACIQGEGRIPLQRFEDFRKHEEGCGSFAYEPAVKGLWKSADLRSILPERISCGIEEGILAWDRQISGFADPDALLAGVESRTSSPVRMERGEDFQAFSHPGLYPCGEGAGYAGGITSAAADGLKVAEAILSLSDY